MGGKFAPTARSTRAVNYLNRLYKKNANIIFYLQIMSQRNGYCQHCMMKVECGRVGGVSPKNYDFNIN